MRIACAMVALAAAVPTLAGSPEIVAGEIGARLDRWLRESEYSGSVLVARGGEVVLRKGYGLADREAGTPYTADTVFTIGSITKSFTAAAIVDLESQGKLRFDDSIARHLPGVPEDKRAITVHHLLTHTSGLDSDFAGDYDPVGRDEYVRRVLASKLRSAPGAQYFYANSGYSLLGTIVELVSGMPYETYLRTHLFGPAGMRDTGYRVAGRDPAREAVGYRGSERWGKLSVRPWAEDGPYWALRANGGLLSTVDDLYRWSLALDTDSPLPATARTRMFTAHVAENSAGDSHYGYGWAISEAPWGGREIGHNGGNGIFSADLRRFPDDRIVVITSANDAAIKAWRAAGALALIAHGDEVPAAPPRPATPAPLGTEGRHAIARAWFDAYATGDPAVMKAFRERNAVAGASGPSDEDRARMLARVRGDFGMLTPQGVIAEDPRSLAVRARAERGGSPTFTFLFDPEGRLEGVRIEAGD